MAPTTTSGKTPRLGPELFAFLNDLASNNERPWFHANKARYDEAVKEPALEFIQSFGPRLQSISPRFEANAKPVGGSLFRIQRDTRFSKDKTPYKENTGIHFRHERAKDAHAPGFYLHLQPRNCFFGVGLWHPETKVAYQIREHISDNRKAWTTIMSSPPFTTGLALGGDSLKRPPKGFDPDDELIVDLKRKDFIATTTLTQKQITAASFIDTFEEMCQETAPFMRFLCDAVDVPFDE